MSKENPQLEDGYTKISNDLLEGILKSDNTFLETKVVLAIIRQTYGWGKKSAAISISQFEKITGSDRRNIQKAVLSLAEREAITRQPGAKMKFGQPVYNYQICKNYYGQFNNRTIVKSTIEAIVKSTHNKEIKYNIKKRRNDLVDKLSMDRKKPIVDTTTAKTKYDLPF